ncbi:MAG: four helix bundle protein [Candidatus Omnitrophota bacterium]
MTNDKIQMTKEIQNSNIKTKIKTKKYDLEERTLKFAKNCIDLCQLLIRNVINKELVSQLIRSSCSVGANYREANDTDTKKDFYHRIGICRREAKESKYWLELLLHSSQKSSDKITPLIDEATQLVRIFASIVKTKG